MIRLSQRLLIVCTLVLMGTNVLASTTTIDFEDRAFETFNSYYNGSDHAGGFTSGGVQFSNFYDDTFGPYWEGWSYSNYTNTDTNVTGSEAPQDPENQYSAYVLPGGGGGNNSSTYGIAYYPGDYNTPRISLPLGYRPSSLQVANLVYPVMSMLHGDFLAGAPFGESDYLRMTIKGYDRAEAMGSMTGTIPVDLAIGTNILSDWLNVDLTGLGNARSLSFKLESSRSNVFGPLTPTFFALDNLALQSLLTGDVNSDGVVNQLDLNVVFGNWLSTSAPLSLGDANGDEVVNQLDINTITGNWLATGSGFATSPVPEPSAALLLTLGASIFLRSRSKTAMHRLKG